jgi:ABC-type antimicrobial peptide transport system permease subunit
VNSVSPQYFDAVGTRLLRGRAFDARDARSAPKVYVINETMAQTLFGNEDAIGRRIAQRTDAAPEWGEIVGIATDTRSVVPDASAVTFQVYQPIAQESRYRAELLVRTSDIESGSAVAAIRQVMAAAFPNLPIRDLQPADTAIYKHNDQYSVLRDILFAFAVLGLALASLGVYGVISRTMAQRTPEFAIRLALGAMVNDIIAMVLRTGVKLAVVGSFVGVIGAVGVVRLLATAFPGMRLETAGPLFAAMLVLIGIALLACWLPARRAGRVDAVVALRAE